MIYQAHAKVSEPINKETQGLPSVLCLCSLLQIDLIHLPFSKTIADKAHTDIAVQQNKRLFSQKVSLVLYLSEG